MAHPSRLRNSTIPIGARDRGTCRRSSRTPGADRVFATIDNSDRYRLSEHLTAGLGITNAGDRAYFIFHPFPQRSVILDVKYAY